MEITSNNPFPIGFRFQPSEEELVLYYLKYKAMNWGFYDPTKRFQELDLYNYTPQQLREIYGVQQEREMYIFVRKVLKHQKGKRIQRRTASEDGYWYWRASTKEVDIVFEGAVIRHRRTLVYHRGKGRGDWIMYEYRLSDDSTVLFGDWLLCKVYLNEKEKIKTQVDFILEPPATQTSSSDIAREESSSTSTFVSVQPEHSSFSSASQWTVEQSTTTINSGSSIQQLDSDESATYCDVTNELLFEGCDV